MRALVIGVLLTASLLGQRPTLTPAETLLEPVVLRAIRDVAAPGLLSVDRIGGTDAAFGEILVSCYTGAGCDVPARAVLTLQQLIDKHGLPRPWRSIRVVALSNPAERTELTRAKAALHVNSSRGTEALLIVQSPWSSASIADEVVEIFARHAPSGGVAAGVDVRSFAAVGQPQWDTGGVPVTTILAGVERSGPEQGRFVVAATLYFLATLPNGGSEALLSHLTVGAHARLAEDGRRAVAQMGQAQRAGADVLIMLGQAIEREQRRMRSFERFMPEPVDPALRVRLADMETGITSVWTSMGISSSPFVAPAERIRGRGGEDRRVVSRTAAMAYAATLEPTQLAKLPNSREIAYEILNFVDGKRSISDIRDAVMAEFGNVPLAAVVEYLEASAKAGQVSIR